MGRGTGCEIGEGVLFGECTPCESSERGEGNGGELGELAMRTCPPGPSRAAHTPTRSSSLELEGRRYFGCGSPKADLGSDLKRGHPVSWGLTHSEPWKMSHTLELVRPSSQRRHWAAPRAGDVILGPVTPTSLGTVTGPARKAPQCHGAQKPGKDPRGLDGPEVIAAGRADPTGSGAQPCKTSLLKFQTPITNPAGHLCC